MATYATPAMITVERDDGYLALAFDGGTPISLTHAEMDWIITQYSDLMADIGEAPNPNFSCFGRRVLEPASSCPD